MAYVVLVGAYERDNFGDILLGKIVEELMAPIPCLWASLIGRDMRAFGGPVVVSLAVAARIMQDQPPIALIHVGGQILAVDTVTALAMDLEPCAPIPSTLEAREALSVLLAGVRPDVGYVSEWSVAGAKVPVVFISVGGTPQRFCELHVRRALKRASFVSVRDKSTLRYARSAECNARLFPDLGHAMGRVFGRDRLSSLNEAAKQVLTTEDPYIVFQANDAVVHGAMTALVSELVRCAKDLGCRVVLQPAGTAAYHDSLSALTRLRDRIRLQDRNLTVDLQLDRNLWTQLATISNCRCWVGTSLHGWIAATSYRRSCVSIAGAKVREYLTTWAPESPRVEPGADGLSAAVRRHWHVPPATSDVSLRLEAGAVRSAELMRGTLGIPVGESLGASMPATDSVALLSAEADFLRRAVVTLLKGDQSVRDSPKSRLTRVE